MAPRFFNDEFPRETFQRPAPQVGQGREYRATVCLWSQSEDETAFAAWLETWRHKMALISSDYGCGCCVRLHDILGPREGIDALPRRLRIASEWTEDL